VCVCVMCVRVPCLHTCQYYMCAFVQERARADRWLCASMCVCVVVCVCVCVCVCERERERKSEGERNRENTDCRHIHMHTYEDEAQEIARERWSLHMHTHVYTHTYAHTYVKVCMYPQKQDKTDPQSFESAVL